MTIAELRVLLGFDATAYKAGAKEVKSVTSSLQKDIAKIGGMIAGAFSVGALISFGRRLLDVADQMDDMAQATNMTMGQMVALKTIAAENGLKMEDLSTALSKVRNAQGEVVALSKPMETALAKLGIDAEEFVSVGTDEALALIARGFAEANGSAEAYSAVQDILGRNSKDLIETLIALNKEGLGPLAERTKEATKGFEEMAAAQKTLDSLWNSIQMGAAKAIGAIAKLAEELGKLSAKEKDKKPSWFKWYLMALNPIYGARELGKMLGEQAGEEAAAAGDPSKPGAPIPAAKPGVSTDVAARRANQAAEIKKKSDEENRKAEAVARRQYFRERENQNERERMKEDFAEKQADAVKEARGIGATASRVAQIGGLIGMYRPGLGAEDRKIKLQEKNNELIAEFNRNMSRLLDKQNFESEKEGDAG